MSDRGEYRPIRTVIVDGPDFRKLTPDAKLVWFFLKLQLGPVGLGVFNAAVHTLSEQTSLTEDRVRDALLDLEDSVWIRREGNVYELVGGLEHEPTINETDKNHKKFVQRYVAGLPNLKLVKRFRARHAEWFTPIDSPPDGHGGPTEGPSKAPGSTETRTRTRTETKTRTRTAVKPKTPASANGQGHGPDASPRDRFLEKFYHDATTDRRKEVIRQLEQTLKPEGVQLARNHVVRAISIEHLNRCISAVLRGKPLRKPDSAVVIVLKKLDDPDKYRGKAAPDSPELPPADDRSDIALLDEWDERRDEAILRWSKAHDAEAFEIGKRLGREYAGDPLGLKGQLKIELTKAAGFPDFDTWAANRRKGAHPMAEAAGAASL